GLPILLEQRCSCEADEDRVRHHRLHHLVQLSALGTVTLVHEHEYFAHGLRGLSFQLFDKGVEVFDVLASEFVNQRTQESRLGLAQLLHEIATAAGAMNSLADSLKYALDLLIQLIPVRQNRDARVRIVFENPFCEQHHDDAFPAALRMPNN